MPLQWTFARSRVTRHLLLIFVTCAIVPIGVLAAWTYHQVTRQLYEQSQLRLHQASKASALAILDRLQSAESQLVALGEAGADIEQLRARTRPLRGPFESVALVRDGQPPEAVFGRPVSAPAPPAEDAAYLAAGGTLLETERLPDGTARPLLYRRRAPGSSDLLVGVLHLDSILDLALRTSLPPQAQFCVLDENHELLHCSLEDPPEIPVAVRAEMDASISGGFAWEDGDHSYLARYWSVLLEPSFHTASWTLVLAEPRANVLAPIAAFRTTFPPAALLCLLVVSLLSISLVRRRLQPLDRLSEGALRIGERNFDANIRVTSGDEFEELADSFNSMSQRLREQFDCLDAMIEVDRAILASLDPPSIADTVVSRIRSIYPCDVACMILCGAEPGDAAYAFLSRDHMDTVSAQRVPPFSPEQRRWLSAHPEHLVLDAADRTLHFLEPLRRAGVTTVVLLPLFVNSELAGALLCGHAAQSSPLPARINFARQLASQAAMALFNAFTIAQNRVLAYYDALTALPNRLLFKERTEQALAHAKRRGDRLAICVLDLDDFKRVNDTLGHDAGDRLLKEVASRISGILRSGTLARMGGDEFTILVREMESIEDPARVAAKVLEELRRPFGLPGREVFITGSIGIAVHPVDGEDLETLMRNADTAMYHAKDDGGGAYQFYTPSMHATALERLTLEGDLRRALERGELHLVYQPIVETHSRDLIGAEALLRWQHPERGVILPEDFISLAEDSGLIVAIGAWALRTACAQSREWQLAGLRPLRIAVNLSSRQLRDGALVKTVREALSASGLYPEHLALELTESMLMNASEETLGCFRELKQMGVHLSLDDFGTGYSSLNYLKQFPLDYVKIDRSFIDEVSGNPEEAAIVRAILAMAHSLKLRVVAEGVEREEQLAFLREHGCDAVQGFLFSEPLPPDAFAKLLAGLEPR